MGTFLEIEEKARECDKILYNMCTVRSKEQRNCVMSRCCGICTKALDCEGICKYLKDELNLLSDN